MKNESHNGWTNYETWLAALWLDNDEGTQNYIRENAESALKNPGAYYTPGFSREEMATAALSETLKAMIEEMAPELSGFMADLLNAALSEINWHEIAKHHVDAVAAELAEDAS